MVPAFGSVVSDVSHGFPVGSPVEIVATGLAVEPAAARAATAFLSDAERQRASRLAFDRDRRRFVVARARLRQLLRFAASDLRFNVSHCDDLAVYAFSHGCEVGIDVEAVRVMGDADDLAARFFSRREHGAYRALHPRDKPLGFFQCWTRKEAFIKALGDGLSYPLNRFDVSLAPGEPARVLRVEGAPEDHRRWHMESFAPALGFVAAVVAERRSSAVDFLEPTDLLAVGEAR